jgi:RimJ/RimL family protein N-acetyltransferase
MTRYEAGRLYLRELTANDVSDAYVAWMNDAETNRFMETRFSVHTREDVAAFVAAKQASQTEHLFGVFETAGGRHVGNLKVGPIDHTHGVADISYLLGEPDARGKGYGAEAVAIGVHIGFAVFGMAKLAAGAYASNLASIRVLEKNGFVVEGRRRAQVAFEGGRADVVILGLLREEWRRSTAVRAGTG